MSLGSSWRTRAIAVASYQLEEEGCLICLESSLRVDGGGRTKGVVLGSEGRCRREFLDELHGRVLVGTRVSQVD